MLNFALIYKYYKLSFAELSDKTIYMYKIYVGLIGTAQWYLKNEGPKKGNIWGSPQKTWLSANFGKLSFLSYVKIYSIGHISV